MSDMRLATFRHDGRGFTIPWLPALDSEQTLVLVFAGANRHDDAESLAEPLRELRRAYPRSHFLVGSGAADDSVAVAIACFEWTTLGSAKVNLSGLRLHSGDVRAAGVQLAKDLIAPGLRGVLLLTDVGSSGGRELVGGLESALPQAVAASGVVTASGDLADPNVSASATAIGFYGADLHFRQEPSSLFVTTIGEGGGTAETAWGDLLALVASTDEALAPANQELPELPACAQSLSLRASATFARAAQVVAPSRAAVLG